MGLGMNQKILIITVFIALGLTSIWIINKVAVMTPEKLSITQESSVVKLISPQEFAVLAKDKNTFLIDVHTPEQTQIPGTDAFIPYDQILANKNKLPTDKSTPILIYCRSGGMSALASKEIAELGYTNVYDLDGGTDAFKEQQVSVQLWPNAQELGTVIYGDIATTTFTLTNYTPLPLKITRVSTSCGCTKATLDKEKLEAYESTTVNVTFDPAVHKDETDMGELSRIIYLETDNPNFTNLESKITATVIKKN
jgi:rhodanese-related sulfurtransferase